MSKEREEMFFNFCDRVIVKCFGIAGKEHPAVLLKEITNAFETCHPMRDMLRDLPPIDRDDFRLPFTVYVIKNRITGRAYVGKALKGFLDRYPKGWWNDSSYLNESLARDVLIYGVNNFTIDITACDDDDHAASEESRQQAWTRNNTYNIRPEATASFDSGGSTVRKR